MDKRTRLAALVYFFIILFSLNCSREKMPTRQSDLNPASSEEYQTHDLINAVRQSNDLQILGWNDVIAEEARNHSLRMASGRVSVGHDGFDGRAESLSNTVGWISIGENVAYNQGYADPVAVAVDGWLKSDGHRRNILGDFNLTGIGIAVNDQAEYYFTQIFVKTR